MEFKVLSDEEMDLVQEGLPLERVPDDFFEAIELSKRQIKALKKAVAQEAQKDTLRQVLEWGDSDCPHVSHHRGKHWCGECWQSLQQALEEKEWTRRNEKP